MSLSGGGLSTAEASAPVLLIHGQPGGARDWERVVAALDPRLQAIPIYRPGWDWQSEAVGIGGNADAAAAVLDARGISMATVVGHSFGAGVAAWLAVSRPERVGALVLVSPGANTAALDRIDRLLAARFVGPTLSSALLAAIGSALAAGPARRSIARRLHLDEELLRDGSRLLRSPRAWRAFSVEQRALFTDLPVLESQLQAISAPTTIVSGTADRIIAPRAASLLATQIPGARLELIEGAGHLLPHQHARRLAAVVTRAALGPAAPLANARDPEPPRAPGRVDVDERALGLPDQRLRDRRG